MSIPQQRQLLHQLPHLLSHPQTGLLHRVTTLPIPGMWKIALSHWLTSFPVSILPLAAVPALVAVSAIAFTITIVLLITLCLSILRASIALMIAVLVKDNHEKKILQLTVHAHTEKSAYATEQFYTLLHTLSQQQTIWNRIAQRKTTYSFEIISTKEGGIRYVVVANPHTIDTIRRSLRSYLPDIRLDEVNDYIEPEKRHDHHTGIVEMKLSNHFALPLQMQKTLLEHDPIAYLTGHMTTLLAQELIAYQVVISPVLSSLHRKVVSELNTLRYRMLKCQPLTEVLQTNAVHNIVSLPGLSILWVVVKGLGRMLMSFIKMVFDMIIWLMDPSPTSTPFPQKELIRPPQALLSPHEQEVSRIVNDKIDRPLFETSIRLLVIAHDAQEVRTRFQGLLASFGSMSSPHQTLVANRRRIPVGGGRWKQFRQRSLSLNTPFHENPILSTSELSDLYHVPFTPTTKTEDLVKGHSRELPAPRSIKNNPDLDVIFGKNTYANVVSDIGLTDDDRSRHMYIIGQTGSGKSTILFHMAKDDIQKNRGVAVVDPHGDLAEELLHAVPEHRINDCIYFNPFDLRYPIGINLLELPAGVDGDEREQEKELVCESVISVFRRVFSKDEHTDAHRIEYILRNTIYTAFTVENATIFTVYDLLNNPKFQKHITRNLDDENLRNFWTNEFGRAGNYQIVKMVSGVTAKVGRFLFSPTAKRILEQAHSTINIDAIVNSGKILICNLAEGKLGEDTAQLLGTMVIAKIQQAAVRRVRITSHERSPFYLFIDEFQNFATASFTKLLSGGRKFGLRIVIAEQSTAQQEDRTVVNVIVANTGTVVCFRSASPIDESLLLAQFAPALARGDIVNLPRFRFYMKCSAVEPEEPFSGETLPLSVWRDPDKLKRLIDASRKNWAIPYQAPAQRIPSAPVETQPSKKSTMNSKKIVGSKTFLPDEEDGE